MSPQFCRTEVLGRVGVDDFFRKLDWESIVIGWQPEWGVSKERRFIRSGSQEHVYVPKAKSTRRVKDARAGVHDRQGQRGAWGYRWDRLKGFSQHLCQDIKIIILLCFHVLGEDRIQVRDLYNTHVYIPQPTYWIEVSVSTLPVVNETENPTQIKRVETLSTVLIHVIEKRMATSFRHSSLQGRSAAPGPTFCPWILPSWFRSRFLVAPGSLASSGCEMAATPDITPVITPLTLSNKKHFSSSEAQLLTRLL